MASRSKGRKALGRGLGALIPNVPTAAAAPTVEASDDAKAGVSELDVALIDANPDQPRRVFADEQLETLADSIRQFGVLQPVVVRRAGERYELIVGERRWRASQLANKQTIPAVVADLAEKDRLEVALVENVQRHDLNPIELALAFRALAEGGATQDEIGKRVGLQRSTIANHLRLLELGKDLQEDIEAGRISMGHAKALLQLSDPAQRRIVRDRILAEELSVRETERVGREPVAKPAPAPKSSQVAAPPAEDPNLNAVVDQLRDRLKTKVRIVQGGKKGRIEIEFFGPTDLTRVVSVLLDGADFP